MIDLPDLMTGVRQFLGKVAIVGEEEHAGGVAVEAANREDALGGGGADKIEYRAATLRIVGSRNIVFWFVEKDVDEVV